VVQYIIMLVAFIIVAMLCRSRGMFVTDNAVDEIARNAQARCGVLETASHPSLPSVVALDLTLFSPFFLSLSQYMAGSTYHGHYQNLFLSANMINDQVTKLSKGLGEPGTNVVTEAYDWKRYALGTLPMQGSLPSYMMAMAAAWPRLESIIVQSNRGYVMSVSRIYDGRGEFKYLNKKGETVTGGVAECLKVPMQCPPDNVMVTIFDPTTLRCWKNFFDGKTAWRPGAWAPASKMLGQDCTNKASIDALITRGSESSFHVVGEKREEGLSAFVKNSNSTLGFNVVVEQSARVMGVFLGEEPRYPIFSEGLTFMLDRNADVSPLDAPRSPPPPCSLPLP